MVHREDESTPEGLADMIRFPLVEPPDERPLILLTGASTGIGLALARALVNKSDRYRLVLTARQKSLPRLERAGILERTGVSIRALDVCNVEERRRLLQEICAHAGGVDILINNAAIAYRSVEEQMSEEEELKSLHTNYLGPLALIRLVLPKMRQKRAGKIINISSVGGMMAMPTMGPYSASKFALEGASEALWYEVRPWNIKVVLVQPGFVHSNSFENIIYSVAAKTPPNDYNSVYTHMSKFIERIMNSTFATPESIATRIMRVIEDPAPALRVPATLDAHLFTLMRRFLPRSAYHWLLYRALPGINTWGKIS